MNLNELRDRAYKIACEHGFHDKAHNDCHWLMLTITELSEVVEADRKDRYFDDIYTLDNFYKAVDEKDFSTAFEEYIKDTVEDELADTVIRLLDLAGLRGIELHYTPCTDLCMDNLVTFCYTTCGLITSKEFNLDTKINTSINSIVSLCQEHLGIDLEWHIEQKMNYNELRTKMHGKAY